MPRQIHLCMDIRGVLCKPDKELKGFTNDDGTDAKPQEVRDFLIEQLRLGYDFYTYGSCDNRDKTGRCAGHEIKEEDEHVIEKT